MIGTDRGPAPAYDGVGFFFDGGIMGPLVPKITEPGGEDGVCGINSEGHRD